MNEPRLTDNETILLGIIREIYLKTNVPVSTETIYIATTRKGFPDWKVKANLMSLEKKDAVKRNDTKWTPSLVPIRRGNGEEVKYDTVKIINVLRNIGRPSKPAEILNKFAQIYGMPNAESFTRYLRQMIADGSGAIERDTYNNYWIESLRMNIRDTNLEQFI